MKKTGKEKQNIPNWKIKTEFSFKVKFPVRKYFTKNKGSAGGIKILNENSRSGFLKIFKQNKSINKFSSITST